MVTQKIIATGILARPATQPEENMGKTNAVTTDLCKHIDSLLAVLQPLVQMLSQVLTKPIK